MGKYRTLGNFFDRIFRNDLNKNFEDIDADLIRLGAGSEEALRAADEADTQAIYANDRGDYADEKGTYAAEQGDYANLKGNLADEKATLANDAATNANLESSNLGEMKTAVTDATLQANEKITYINEKQPLIEQSIMDASEAKSTAESVETQFNQIITETGDSIPEITQARGGEVNLNARLEKTAAQLAETGTEIKKINRNNLSPKFVEYLASFNRFGIGAPMGIANYTGGNYVLTVSGNAGDSFVTVVTGNIVDAGVTTRWACVIENSDGLFDMNQVTGTDGISKINLLEPLKKSITSKRLGNLHDANLGQHYTELGYFAFAQHLYLMNTRYAERKTYIAQFKPNDNTGKWVSNAYNIYNQVSGMINDPGLYAMKIAGSHFFMSANDNADYAEWEQKLSGEKGYIESYIGLSGGTAIVEFYKDGVLSDTTTIGTTVKRVIFNYENVQVGKIKIIAQGGFTPSQGVYIGLTTWWSNNKYQNDKLLKNTDKIAYIGDSWGVYNNNATVRELERLMSLDGESQPILNFSVGGMSTAYAKAWFDDYIIANRPDKVIIEYFTNDFNTINAPQENTFVDPDGNVKTRNISSLNEYVSNMNYMIDKAIENGIEPIIVMPAMTNSSSQVLTFANFAVQLWLGKAFVNENPSLKNPIIEKVSTSIVESTGTSGVGGNTLKIVSKEINSSARKGIMSDSNVHLTAADIHGFYNNGVRKAGVRADGTIDMNTLQLKLQTFPVVASDGNRGMLYVKQGAEGSADELYVIIKQADGAFASKKVQLID